MKTVPKQHECLSNKRILLITQARMQCLQIAKENKAEQQNHTEKIRYRRLPNILQRQTLPPRLL